MKRRLFIIAILLTCTLLMEAQTQFRNLSLDEAITLARKEQKMVFVDFFTTWCGPCKRMLSSVLPSTDVGAFMNKHFVCIMMNAESEGTALAKQLKVTAYPTFIVLDSDGKEVGRMRGYREGTVFIKEMRMILNRQK